MKRDFENCLFERGGFSKRVDFGRRVCNGIRWMISWGKLKCRIGFKRILEKWEFCGFNCGKIMVKLRREV